MGTFFYILTLHLKFQIHVEKYDQKKKKKGYSSDEWLLTSVSYAIFSWMGILDAWYIICIYHMLVVFNSLEKESLE